MKSWNKDTNKDCFGNGNPSDIDHIWPTSKGGSNISENKMRLSKESNREKNDKTKGKVNGIRFSVVRAMNSNGDVYGKMQIKNSNDEWEWVEVIK